MSAISMHLKFLNLCNYYIIFILQMEKFILRSTGPFNSFDGWWASNLSKDAQIARGEILRRIHFFLGGQEASPLRIVYMLAHCPSIPYKGTTRPVSLSSQLRLGVRKVQGVWICMSRLQPGGQSSPHTKKLIRHSFQDNCGQHLLLKTDADLQVFWKYWMSIIRLVQKQLRFCRSFQ